MTENKRNYYRIDDMLRLDIVPVTENGAQDKLAFKRELAELHDNLASLIALAYQESAVIGEAMGLLNRKLDLLAGPEEEPAVTADPVKVNISGAGIGWRWTQALYAGDLVDITMVLKPSNVPVTLRAEIIRADKEEEHPGRWWIRAAFSEHQETGVEQIIQHVNHRQMQLLANRQHRREVDAAFGRETD